MEDKEAEHQKAEDQGLVKIPKTGKLYRFTTLSKEEAIKKYDEIHSRHKIIYYDKIDAHGDEHYIRSSENVSEVESLHYSTLDEGDTV